MAVSREGLSFDTPDGEPVHCMVLLATPDSERDRHLQVMAGIAGTLGRKSAIRDQLFNAVTAAHVHDVLHAEESETFNYFLTE
jgi:mannitol/fructose-specific phosphotransferase system IIA component (Ntr-type)